VPVGFVRWLGSVEVLEQVVVAEDVVDVGVAGAGFQGL
jgi:hypothetical protein